ncbi:MAG: dynamin family protein [Prevotella sp.]|nr:dynamin family protein [Candidatus Prevotella equi]
MDTTTIIYIVVAAVVGIILGKMFFSKGSSDTDVQEVATSSEDKSDEYKKQISDVKAKLADAEKKAKDIKVKYEGLLNEANSKAKELDEQLKAALEGHIDDSIKEKLADVEKLKKKIKQLEDENEEFEDDLDSYKKKLKTKESQFSTLQADFDKLTREKKQLQEDLTKKSDELEEKAKALELKIQSLTFVQEILTAKKSNDSSVSALYTKIDTLSDFIRGELKDTVCGIYNLNKETSDGLFGSGLDSWAITAKKSWIQGKKTIAFVGEFSAGKTSIVNRILSQDNPHIPLLPVSSQATTAIPTYISGGVGTMYQFFSTENELKSISESTFKRVNKEVLDQVQGISSIIRYFVMSYKNPNLNNLSILDTPGFNSNDKEDVNRTLGVINECDALYWVIDVNTGTLNQTSINVINGKYNNGVGLTKPLFVILSHADDKTESQISAVKDRVDATLKENNIKVQKYITFACPPVKCKEQKRTEIINKFPVSLILDSMKQISHDDSKENYIDTLHESLKYWVAEQEKDVVKAKRDADSLLTKCNNITDQYTRAIRNMINDCHTVADIPQYEEHLFRKDNYEMSQYDYNRMINLLDTICGTRCETLCDLYDSMNETSSELQNAWNTHAEEREKWQRLNNCLDILNNKIKELKKK